MAIGNQRCFLPYMHPDGKLILSHIPLGGRLLGVLIQGLLNWIWSQWLNLPGTLHTSNLLSIMISLMIMIIKVMEWLGATLLPPPWIPPLQTLNHIHIIPWILGGALNNWILIMNQTLVILRDPTVPLIKPSRCILMALQK
jgi:hypothetical protein